MFLDSLPPIEGIIYLFVLGACVGSFLNVVIHRLPKGMSLLTPPSHCPYCKTRLHWYDNIPVIGWIYLRGKCRYCGHRISPRYPIIEAITGGLFVFYYIMFFLRGIGMAASWPMYFLDMALISGLLAASVIDAEDFIIPAGIPWFLAGAGIVMHAVVDRPNVVGNILIGPAKMSLSAGAGLGLAISIVLLHFGVFPLSFAEGDLMDHEREELSKKNEEVPPEMTAAEVRTEMRKEMLFLIPPMLLGGISLELHIASGGVARMWAQADTILWLNAGLGALFGGMAAAFLVWIIRILGSYAVGREAMGLGDVHLMFGIGAVLGAGAASVAFFIAPFLAILVALYMRLAHRQRQFPYGPFLSLAAAIVMLCYGPIEQYYQPMIYGCITLIHQLLGR